MDSQQRRLVETGADYRIEIFRSSQAFSKLFDGVRRLRCVTYCDSPDLLLELFDEYGLDELEVVVGDASDYREGLVGLPDVADRLEQLKEDGRLLIYTCPTKTVHSKLYELERTDGSLTLLVGSQNLTSTGWGNQTNAAVVFDTQPNTPVHDEFREVYEDHRDRYGELFLEDLTEAIDESDDERDEVIERWVEGRTSAKSEFDEFYGELSDKVVEAAPDPDESTRIPVAPHPREDADRQHGQMDDDATDFVWGGKGETDNTDGDAPPAEKEIVQSLKNFTDRFRDDVAENFNNYGRVTGETLRITPVRFAQQTETAYGVPIMRVREDRQSVYLGTQNGEGYFGEPLPDDPAGIDPALEHLEAYFETFEKHANSRNVRAFQTHVFEALLYFLWAPFINRHATVYREERVRNLDKRLPFLYIHGESDSGKGTFARFALHLLSGGQVTTPLDADEFGTKMIRRLRGIKTSFPLVIDDVQKKTINRTDPLRNFWSGWSPDQSYPALVFISNDTKPDAWFRNRAKVLHFDGRFTSGIEGEIEVNHIIDEGNPLFHWFCQLYLDRDVQPHDDILLEAREVVGDIYAAADRPLPEYFPNEPAETKYDIGRRRWQRAYDDGKFTMFEEDGILRLEFTQDMASWEISGLTHELPSVGVQRYGNDLVIEDIDRFTTWLHESDTGTGRGLFAAIKAVLGR